MIAGELRGRRLVAPRGTATRPTSDRVREAVFSALGDFRGAVVLDLFAGSGAMAIEALSRGAAGAVAVERAAPALRALRQNVDSLELAGRLRVVGLPVERALTSVQSSGPFDLIFADPPYAALPAGNLAKLLAPYLALLAPAGGLVLEHAARDLPPSLSGLELSATRRYGDTAISRYVAGDEPEHVPG